MRLTGELLTQIEQSSRVTLTPEQRVIMLYWYGYEPRHGWDEEDFMYGIRDVTRYYPDHRPKRRKNPPAFSSKSAGDEECPF